MLIHGLVVGYEGQDVCVGVEASYDAIYWDNYSAASRMEHDGSLELALSFFLGPVLGDPGDHVVDDEIKKVNIVNIKEK